VNTALITLWLNNNQLTGVIPTSFGLLLSLQNLFLHNNLLSGQIPLSIAAMLSLGTCVVSQNPDLCRAESFTKCGTDIPGT
jgi:hypothetical protein